MPARLFLKEEDGQIQVLLQRPVLGLPWELLRDPQRHVDLALEMTGFNRTLSVAGEAAAKADGERLRVLMVIARPAGVRDVGYQMIARPLLERLEPVAGEVDFVVLRWCVF